MSAITTHAGAPPRQRNARGEGERLHEQLVEAAVALLEAEGDASRVSVRSIARQAGVSPTALYLHFPDRDALVSAAVDRGFEAFNAALASAAADCDEPRLQVREMGLAYLAFAERQPALYAVLFSTRRPLGRPASSPAGDVGRIDRGEALEALAAAVSAASPATGPAEGRELAMVLWAALHGYAALCARRSMDGWPDAEEYVDRMLSAHLDR